MKTTKTYVLIGALSALSAISTAATSTWSYSFSKTIKNGGEGFQALTTSDSNPDTLSTTINSLQWSIYSVGTKKYAVTAGGGQTIGTGADQASSYTSFYTYEMPGKIQSVRIKARRNANSDGADLKISVNGVQYLCEGAESVALTTDSLLYEFKPAIEAQEGKLDIELFQNAEKKSALYIKSIAVDYEKSEKTEVANWEYFFYQFISKGGEGFQAISNSESNPDTLSTTINNLKWSIYSEGTKKFGVTPTSGQAIGAGTNQTPSFVSFFTYEIPGKIRAIRVNARRHVNSEGADLKVSVNGVQYLCNGAESVALASDTAIYEFKPGTDAQEGKLDIELFQNVETRGILYIRSVSVDYEVEASGIQAPKFSLPEGSYAEAQTVSLQVDGYEEGTYTIYYTTNGDSPVSPEGSRKVYTEPISIDQSMTISAVTCVDGKYSPVVKAKYVIKEDPRLSFSKDSVTLEAPDNGYSPYLNNPRQVSPIIYTSSNNDVCVVSKNSGDLFTVAPGECIISAIFAGNDEYKSDTAKYVLTVLKKEPLNKPVLSPMGGTFDGPVEVSVSVEDERAYTIWYSTTAQDSAELTEEPTIIKATSGKIKITKSCHLLVLAAGYNVFSPLVEADFIINEKAAAMFGADEANKAYYKQGFDSAEDMDGWLLYNTSTNYTFKLMPTPTLKPNTDFATIDPDSKYSLNIRYTSSEKQDELLLSPKMTIRPNTTMEFYSFFSGVWLVYANWGVGVYDVEKDESEILVDAFQWAQKNEFTGPAWIRFTADLSDYAGRDVQFFFSYVGQGGDDVAFDGFKLMEQDYSEAAQITINEGDSVHFHDLSTSINHWQWEFPGGVLANEDEQNPVVTYAEAGTYDVKLIVWNDKEERDTLIRKDYVEVKAEMPKAIAGLPTEGYLSPFRAVFVPTNVPVTFHDLSTGKPTERMWTFQGTDIEHSTEADPVVTYFNPGTYGVSLQVSNKVGTDNDILKNAIQAGGAQYIWNIKPEENQDLAQIGLGYYGNYAGSNWLMIYEFAEKFDAPLAPATIDSVTVYFASTETVTPDTLITVSIRESEDGLPGKVLASGSVKAGDLNWDDQNVVGTCFHLDQTAEVTGEFFVSIGGMPNNTDDATYQSDNIAVLCGQHNDGRPGTIYHYLDTTEGYEPSGICEWTFNADENLSMAICPVLDYGTASAIEQLSSVVANASAIFNLNGQKVSERAATQGLYIINGKKVILK